MEERRRLGAWYTPTGLVEQMVTAAAADHWMRRRATTSGTLHVLDPACGDGRFLEAVARRAADEGVPVTLWGIDVDPDAVTAARRRVPGAHIRRADALSLAVGDRPLGRGGPMDGFDLVIGNPPFLSQLAAATSRGGTSRLGGGPYADVAVEFLALAVRLVAHDGGRVGFVLPQSVLSSRDAASVRRMYDELASLCWSWWSPERMFDAQVITCALVFEFDSSHHPGTRGDRHGSWAHVVTRARGLPPLPTALSGPQSGTRSAGSSADQAPAPRRLDDLARLNANFRDEYYGMVPAVDDHGDGPPLITSGLIDPGRCWWGSRAVRFARRSFVAPRVDLGALDARMATWAAERLVPKVLVANQTSVIEAVCDPSGAWLPGVPVVAAYPRSGSRADAWRVAAVLTSASASLWAWHRHAGTGLSAATIRVGPAMLAELPWPAAQDAAGLVERAVCRLRRDDVVGCGDLIDRAYGLSPDEAHEARRWWSAMVDRIDRRSPQPRVDAATTTR